MKKFAFALDKVLDYKGQVENSLRSEYAQKMAKVKKQEVYIDSLISQFAGCRNEFEARKKQGCTVNLMVSYPAAVEFHTQYCSHTNQRYRNCPFAPDSQSYPAGTEV